MSFLEMYKPAQEMHGTNYYWDQVPNCNISVRSEAGSICAGSLRFDLVIGIVVVFEARRILSSAPYGICQKVPSSKRKVCIKAINNLISEQRIREWLHRIGTIESIETCFVEWYFISLSIAIPRITMS